VSLWLNSGVPATNVAERAGQSVEVLLKIYAKCIDGDEEIMNKRIETSASSAPRRQLRRHARGKGQVGRLYRRHRNNGMSSTGFQKYVAEVRKPPSHDPGVHDSRRSPSRLIIRLRMRADDLAEI
jgi:hypothetical protein